MNEYKTIKIDRLFHGFCSIRDYQLKEAVKEGKGIKIICNEEYIIIPWEDLGKHFENDEVFVSKHNPLQKYKLCDFDWKTFKPRKSDQLQFDITQTVQTL